ncbi:MAG: DoxX family protein [Alistipes sp.]|nr:DoxX family protein [Alistipes sp.]
MKTKLLEVIREYRHIDRAILVLRLYVGALIALHVIGKLQTYNFIIDGYPALLFDNTIATFVIFTSLESLFAVMIMIGFGTRFAAFIMSLGMFVEAFVIFGSLGRVGIERQALYIAIYLFLTIAGGGRYALDSRVARRRMDV